MAFLKADDRIAVRFNLNSFDSVNLAGITSAHKSLDFELDSSFSGRKNPSDPVFEGCVWLVTPSPPGTEDFLVFKKIL
jgi:hypothetical protein